MKSVRLDLSRLLGFKIIGKIASSFSDAKIGAKPTMQGADTNRRVAAIGAKIGMKPV